MSYLTQLALVLGLSVPGLAFAAGTEGGTPPETTETTTNPHSPSKSLILLSGSQYFRYKSWC